MKPKHMGIGAHHARKDLIDYHAKSTSCLACKKGIVCSLNKMRLVLHYTKRD